MAVESSMEDLIKLLYISIGLIWIINIPIVVISVLIAKELTTANASWVIIISSAIIQFFTTCLMIIACINIKRPIFHVQIWEFFVDEI